MTTKKLSKTQLAKLRVQVMGSISPQERLELACFNLLEEELDQKVAELIKLQSAS